MTELANRFLAAFRYDRARLEEIEVHPLTPAAAAKLLDTQLGDLVRVRISTLPGWNYTGEYWVQRITHSITADDWVVSLRIDSSDLSPPLDVGAFDEGFSTGFFVPESP